MAQFLANRIKGGHLTIDDVPESLREQVQAFCIKYKAKYTIAANMP